MFIKLFLNISSSIFYKTVRDCFGSRQMFVMYTECKFKLLTLEMSYNYEQEQQMHCQYVKQIPLPLNVTALRLDLGKK